MSEYLIYKIFEGISVFFETFIVHQYISAFFEKKRDKIIIAFGYMGFCAGLMLFSLSSKIMMISALYTVIGIFILITLLYKSGIVLRLFSTILFAVIVMTSEAFCSSILEILGGIDVAEVMTYGMPRVFFITVAKIVQIFIVKFVGIIIKLRRYEKTDIEVKRVLPLFITQILSVLITYHIAASGIEYGYFGLTVFISIIGILYINGMIFWYFDNIKAAYEYKSLNEAAEIKLKHQTQYYELMEIKQKETDCIRHDIRKHLNYIESLIESGLHEDAKRYSHELDEQFQSTALIDEHSYMIINTFLNVEKIKAEEENINLSICVNICREMKVSNPDLGIILGNIFENAIEACRYISNVNERRIKLDVYQRDDMLLIEMENVYNPDAKLKTRIGRHGYGLKNIQRVAVKYGGDVMVTSSNNIFFVRVIV
ncbi:MAG: GHKL domain-containing protein [Lachnospiraceae bacterium]|nr:GHKL domain-containing protein [Lachnospiraceae bacterium]